MRQGNLDERQGNLDERQGNLEGGHGVLKRYNQNIERMIYIYILVHAYLLLGGYFNCDHGVHERDKAKAARLLRIAIL